MSAWDLYQSRAAVGFPNKRDEERIREVRDILRKLPDNLSYTTVTMWLAENSYNIDGETNAAAAFTQNCAIINSDNLNEKTMLSMPGEDIECGSLVWWMNNYWIVAERDANTTLYTRTKLLQCNHLLKWVSNDDVVIEQWSIVEDGTKLTDSFRAVRAA